MLAPKKKTYTPNALKSMEKKNLKFPEEIQTTFFSQDVSVSVALIKQTKLSEKYTFIYRCLVSSCQSKHSYTQVSPHYPKLDFLTGLLHALYPDLGFKKSFQKPVTLET